MSTSFSTEPQLNSTSFQQPSPTPRRSQGKGWLFGALLVALGFFIVGGMVVVGGACYVAANLDRWLVGLGREAIVAMINESEIPAAEKTEVITQIDRVVTAYKDRRINQADLENALTELGEAPAMKVLALYGLDEVFLTSTSLTEDENAAGRRTYQRALRGVYEGKFTEDDVYAVLPLDADNVPVTTAVSDSNSAGDNITLVANSERKSAPGDDIHESVVKLKLLADNAGIPDEPFQLDIGDEVKKIVDRLLAGKDEPQ